MKFDIVVGNPPYNDDSGSRGKSRIWDVFVEKAFDILMPNGFLCFIHPPTWRQPNHSTGIILKQKNMLFFNINDVNDGQNTFGVSTRYDWYIIQNCSYQNHTVIIDENNIEYEINMNEWPFIPNSHFEDVKKMFAQQPKDACVIVNNSYYHAGNNTQVSNKDDKHILPCVYSVNKQDKITLKWSCRDKNPEHFVPKVIFGSGATGFFVDKHGEYGVTEWCVGIVDDPKNLDKIVKALKSDKFKQIQNAISISSGELNRSVLPLFKKDFWKEFIDEDE